MRKRATDYSNRFPLLSRIAGYVRFHHVDWERGKGQEQADKKIPPQAHIPNLADRIAVLLHGNERALSKREQIREVIRKDNGMRLHPTLQEIFLDQSGKESFWLEVGDRNIDRTLLDYACPEVTIMDLDTLESFGRFLSRLIELRSRYTAAHSTAVGRVGAILARKAGFSNGEVRMMQIAGYLHDIGKLGVPLEILDKPSALTEDEANIVRCHSYYTYRTLQTIPGMETINLWASLHHQRLDGTGYPFRYADEQLPLGSRILAVADVFTALTEDRLYRKGLEQREVLLTLGRMAGDNEVDARVVDLVSQDFKEIEHSRSETYAAGIEAYNLFQKENGNVWDAVSQASERSSRIGRPVPIGNFRPTGRARSNGMIYWFGK